MKRLSELLLTQTKRQEKFLLEDIKIADDEENLIQQIQHIPLLSGVNPHEKELIEELVYKQKEDITEFISPVHVKSKLNIKDGDKIKVELK